MSPRPCTELGLAMERRQSTYDQIVSALNLPPAYIDKHKAVIVERLADASCSVEASRMPRQENSFTNDSVLAINQCMHIAASVALLGSDPERIAAAKDVVARSCQGLPHDATTVVSIAVLLHLLERAATENWEYEHGDAQPAPSARLSSLPPPRGTQNEPRAGGLQAPPGYVELLREQLDLVNWMVGAEVLARLRASATESGGLAE